MINNQSQKTKVTGVSIIIIILRIYGEPYSSVAVVELASCLIEREYSENLSLLLIAKSCSVSVQEHF